MADPLARLFARFGLDLSEFEAGLGKIRKGMQSVGRGMRDVGIAISAGITAPVTLAVREAINFESAFAGVQKTVDGTDAQISALRSSIIGMSEELPFTTTEIANVAQAAGQLGIETDNIAAFARTMLQLGTSTNLSSENAAVSLARLTNITGLSQDKFDSLGSALVALGNNMATTEAEITDLALRIAGAGTQVGLTEDQILGFAAAISSVGISAEAGGTAISRVFVEMAKQAKSGGDQLKAFALISGKSVSDFRRDMEEDAAGAVRTFIGGLGDLQEAGADVFTALEILGFQNVRVRDTLLRLTSAEEQLTTALGIGAQAFEDATALEKEFARFAGTTESEIKLLFNSVRNLGRELGEALLPTIKTLIETGRSLVSAWQKLDEAQKENIAQWAGILAIAGPLTIALGALFSLVAAHPFAIMVAGIAAAAAAFSVLNAAAAEAKLEMVGLGNVGRSVIEIEDRLKAGFVAASEALLENTAEMGEQAAQLEFMKERVEALTEAEAALSAILLPNAELLQRVTDQLEAEQSALESLQAVQETEKTNLEELAEKWQEYSEKVLGASEETVTAMDMARAGADAFATGTGRALGQALTRGKSFSRGLSDAMKQLASSFIANLFRMGVQLVVFDRIEDTVSKKSALREAVRNAAKAFGNVFQAVTKALPFPIDLIVAPIAAAGAAALVLAGATAFAEGGIAMGPTFAHIAEREPELVLPLSQADRFLGRGGPVVINVYHDDELQTRRVLQQVPEVLDIEIGGGVA